jgi:hypothetical protein
MKGSVGINHPRWKGGKKEVSSRNKRYVAILNPSHPRNRGRYVFQHILIAEKVIGKLLPVGVVIHHVDGNGLNNENKNLVICENEEYHRLLHKKARAFYSCGDSNMLKCRICKEYDSKDNLMFYGKNIVHKVCNAKIAKERRSNHG